MPSLTDTLEQAIHRAIGFANARHHELATLEHLLLALVDEPDAARVMRACAVDLSELRANLTRYIDVELEPLKFDTNEGEAAPSTGFQRVIQRAAIHVQSSGRSEVTGANVLVAIFNERESHAAFFLQEQDMSRYDAVNFLNHGVAKDPAFGEVRPVRDAGETGRASAIGGKDGGAPPGPAYTPPPDLSLPSRDLAGYGASRPEAKWPGGARIAVNFCINYEEGAELCLLNGDDRSEVRVSDLVVPGRVGARDLNMESNYEFGSRVGYWRLLRAFTDRGLPATVNLVGLAGELVPEPLAAMIEAGFDLQPHGWRWIDFHELTEDEERAYIRQSYEQVVELTGSPPMGYYAGMPSINTRRLAIEAGYVYDSDCYNDELPYWTRDFGKPHLVIPYSLETNDSRFGRKEGYQVGEEFFTYLKDSFDVLYAEGAERPGMMTVGLHARLLGRPGRIGALYRILDYMAGHERVWICRRDDIARHWIATHPAV